MKFNLPNRLTVIRILLIPLFMAFMLVEAIPGRMIFALALFVIASLTDLVDGYLARKNNQITDFGKFLDPLADKLLVAAALVCFVELGFTSSWVVIIIIAREFLVTSLRLVASGKGEVIAASFWGKVKTNSQMISVIAVFLCAIFGWPMAIGSALLWVAAALTLISGAQYIWQYRNYIYTAK
jgi:CDP-diacylglycerol--glycerol-3-phosphate 3-phosphatidyltransferase